MATHRSASQRKGISAAAVFGLLALFMILGPASVQAASLVLAWESAGQGISYRIYYGTQSGTYTGSVDAGQATTCVIGNLSEGATYYLAAVSYTGEVESDLSGELSYRVPVLDSDGDGLSDSEEAYYGTDADTADSDGDGIGDAEEVAQWGTGWSEDNDGDGLINLLDPTPDGAGSGPTDRQRKAAAMQAIRILLLDS